MAAKKAIMEYRQYYSNSFFDVSRMQLKEASPFMKYLLLQDAHATFFGGKQWQACEKDLEKIASENRIHLVISLFYMVMTAYTLQKHFPQTYEVYRSLTRFPVFGTEEEGRDLCRAPGLNPGQAIGGRLFFRGAADGKTRNKPAPL